MTIVKCDTVCVWTKIVLLVGANMTLLAGASLSPGMPAMMEAFKAVPGVAFWVSMIITLPAFFVVIGGPVTGALTDKYGRKPVLAASLLLCGVSGTAGYFIHAMMPLLVTRALVGLSIAGATTATNALIADYFEGQERAKFMGYQAAIGGLGLVVFLPLGGFLAEINWFYAFLTYSPLLLLFALAVLFVKEPQLISHQDIARKDVGLSLNLTKVYILGAAFLCQFAFMTIPVYIAYFMEAVLDAGGMAVGLVGAGSGIFSFLGAMFYERISRKGSFRMIAVIGFFVFGLGFLILGLASSWPPVLIGQWVLGLCLGVILANLTTWLSHEFSPLVRGRANGFFVTLMFLGQFSTTFVYTPIINLTGYHVAYLISGGIVLLTGVGGLFIRKKTEKVHRV